MINLANTNSKEEVTINKLYGADATLSKKDFLEKYKVKPEGLTSDQAIEKLKNLGLNEMKQAKPKKWYNYFLSTFLDFFEEFRSNKAAEKLKELVATTTTVIRDGREMQIPIKEVTIGDIILLSAGSMIPADLRIIEAKDLYVGQSSLTRRIR